MRQLPETCHSRRREEARTLRMCLLVGGGGEKRAGEVTFRESATAEILCGGRAEGSEAG